MIHRHKRTRSSQKTITSDYCIPLDIQEEIIKRLPVKSLIRFTSVSKQWKSLINSSKFISDYHICNIQPHHLLVGYEKPNYFGREYVSVVDDDTSPQQKFSLTLPVFASPHTEPRVLGSSQGLFCVLYDTYDYKNRRDLKYKIAVIWNPTIRKSVDIVVPSVLDRMSYHRFLGFGVLPHTGDPMLVKITCINIIRKTDTATDIPRQVEVFALSSGAWRSPSINLPRKSIQFTKNQVVINEFIYWSAYDRYFVDDKLKFHNVIMSFDMTSEEFAEVHLPDSFAHLSISKLRESLVVVEGEYTSIVNIWTMHNADPKSLTVIFTINTPGDQCIYDVFGFRNSGEPFIGIIAFRENELTLCVYEPNSKHISDMGISGKKFSSFLVIPYMETLLLLDH